MKDLRTFFSYMNDVNFPYVVLRNWDNLPDSVKLGEHSDLDLLVYDLEHWREIFPEAKRVYSTPRVQFKIPVNNSFIQTDIRYVGDGYYPERLEKLLLETRERHAKGFYVPNVVMTRLALAYHVVHHKNRNTYKGWLGDVSVEELLKALKESDIGWVPPSDPSVGRFNQYMKGATATVEKEDGKIVKTQVGYKDYDLIGNEARILAKCKSKHFPKIYKAGESEIRIEDCGEELTLDNLPDNWKQQLIQIIKDLRSYGAEHRDIRPDNLMVKNGIIKLIDFGWARLKDDPPDNPPACLGYPYRASWGPDDNFAMTKVIREFQFKKEEKDDIGTNNKTAIKGDDKKL